MISYSSRSGTKLAKHRGVNGTGVNTMTSLSLFPLLACFFVLALGAASVLKERGYHFDLRRKARRKDQGRAGGRRAEDRLVSAS